MVGSSESDSENYHCDQMGIEGLNDVWVTIGTCAQQLERACSKRNSSAIGYSLCDWSAVCVIEVVCAIWSAVYAIEVWSAQ